jgi:hypothetical protein
MTTPPRHYSGSKPNDPRFRLLCPGLDESRFPPYISTMSSLGSRYLSLKRWSTVLVQRQPEDTEEYQESERILKGWPPLEGNDASKLEYLKHLISLASDDMKQVTVYVSVAFAVTALLLSGKLSENVLAADLPVRVVLMCGIALLAASGTFFYRYVRRIHITRMALARCIPSLDIVRARELWAGAAGMGARHLRAYNVGLTLLLLGFLCEGYVAAAVIL